MKILVILIDNHKDYTWVLSKRLKEADILVLGTLTHYECIQSSLTVFPDAAIVGYNDMNELKQTIESLKQRYPKLKIIVNTMVHDRDELDVLTKTGIHGLIFDALQNREEVKLAVNSVINNQSYFKF